LQVEVGADPPATGSTRSYPFTLEEDRNQPIRRWFDNFDSGLPPWSPAVLPDPPRPMDRTLRSPNGAR